MKAFTSHVYIKIISVAVAVAAVGLVLFYFLTAQAVTQRIVGSLTVSLVPNGGSVKGEYIDIEYNGFGTAQLNGWKIQNVLGDVMSLDDISIENAKTIRLCEENSADTKCTAYWSGNDTYDNAGDTLRIIDGNGTQVISVAYSNAQNGNRYPGNGPFTTEVLEKNDKVQVCSATNKGDFQLKNSNAVTIANSFENQNDGGPLSPDDIVRSFFYDVGKGLKYYPGSRWPDDASLYDNNCQ